MITAGPLAAMAPRHNTLKHPTNEPQSMSQVCHQHLLLEPCMQVFLGLQAFVQRGPAVSPERVGKLVAQPAERPTTTTTSACRKGGVEKERAMENEASNKAHASSHSRVSTSIIRVFVVARNIHVREMLVLYMLCAYTQYACRWCCAWCCILLTYVCAYQVVVIFVLLCTEP